MEGEILIRKYRKTDRNALRKISYETSFLEKADELFDEPQILADALTLYFTDTEPESCFVAQQNNLIIGYIIGAKNESKMSQIAWLKIYPFLVWRAMVTGIFFKAKTLRFLAGVWASFRQGEFHSPDFTAEYPAILHINIARHFRGGGVGGKLLRSYLDYLKAEGIRGVHLSTMSESGKNFFEKNGFRLLFTTSRSFLRYYFRKDIPVFILGKKIEL